MCFIVLMAMEKADYTEYELTLKLKPVFLLLLCCAPLCVLLFCEQQLFKVFKFPKTHSKVFEELLHLIFQTSKHIVLFCSKHIMNPVFSVY